MSLKMCETLARDALRLGMSVCSAVDLCTALR